MSAIDLAKRMACEVAVEGWLKNEQVVGVGSGSTVEYAVEAIAKKAKQAHWRIKCVPSSFQARELLIKNNVEMTTLDVDECLDVAFDGADEVSENLTLIKGGGGCLLQEKIIASCAKDFIVLADERKFSKKLGTQWTKGLPIEVVPMAYKPVQKLIQKRFGGEVVIRPAVTKLGPQLSDNGNFLLDWKFDSTKDYDWSQMETELLRIPGVVETGLFVDMARKVYIGRLDGSVSILG